MATYVVQRLLQLVLVVWGMSVLIFVISHVLPTDPARAIAGDMATEAMIEALRKEMGLDESMFQQYVIYLKSLLRGDLGRSFLSGRPVLDDMLIYFPATMELGVTSILLSLALGIPLGILAAVKRGSLLDHGSRGVSMIGAAMPIFWYGLMLQLIFYRQLRWLPIGGRMGAGFSPPPHVTGLYSIDAIINGNWTLFADVLKHLILPALALSLVTTALVTRITRSSMLEVLHQDYVNTARAKGLKETRVLIHHVLRNASLPIITVLGLQIGRLFGGAVLAETVFSWPGVGRYAVKAIEFMDFPVLMSVAVIVAFFRAGLNLIIDLTYGALDPRIKYD